VHYIVSKKTGGFCFLRALQKSRSRINVFDVGRNMVKNLLTTDGEGALPELDSFFFTTTAAFNQYPSVILSKLLD